MANVLIIEDEEIICKMLSSVIRRTGHDTEYALTLENGLEKASSGTFDVVFLDIRMPDGNGLHVLPGILQMSSLPEVIVVTGYGDPEDAKLAIKSGVWDYIQKPFSMELLIQKLVSVIQYREEKKVSKPPVTLKLKDIVGNTRKILKS